MLPRTLRSRRRADQAFVGPIEDPRQHQSRGQARERQQHRPAHPSPGKLQARDHDVEALQRAEDADDVGDEHANHAPARKLLREMMEGGPHGQALWAPR